MATETEKNTDIEALRRERKVTRSLFTRSCKLLETLLAECTDAEYPLQITAQYCKVQDFQNQLNNLDRDVRQLLRNNLDDAVLEKEMEDAAEYRTRWITVDCLYKNRKSNDKPNVYEKRNFKLPALQFILFDGELKTWLPFWGQFQKIDKDPHIDIHDKYQYLLQAMKDGSEPKMLVETFTPAAYNECLAQLKARYAREELLIQVYVRELLGMVNKIGHSEITSLFDKLSAQLRALETLGVTKDKFAAFLLPMVESALPQEILKIWERTKQKDNSTTMELSDLLAFLQKEVESEQRIRLAKNTFDRVSTVETSKCAPTAECLLTNIKPKGITQNICVWCDKDSHNSLECFKLHRMNMDERRDMLKKKKACNICLKPGHHAKFCKSFMRCIVCGQRHTVVLCTGLKQESRNNGLNTNSSAAQYRANNKSTSVTSKEAPITTANISADLKHASGNIGTTLLQTVPVIISNGQQQMMVRAMFDNGAQRSYIKEEIVSKLNIAPVGNEILSHTLFGGVEITSKQYNVYDINVTSVDKTFSFQIIALGQQCICKNIPQYNKILSDKLKLQNINLNENLTDNDIGLLIGADYGGLLLTNTLVDIEDKLFAIKTKLGWTLQGKSKHTHTHQNFNFFCASDSEISNFWCLEMLGIRDPVEIKTKQQSEEEVLASFEENVAVNEEDRYEVILPWKVGHDELLDNYDLTSRRLQSVTKKLKLNGLYEGYNKVINEWNDQGIIEIVSDPRKNREVSHYLPHRPVLKEKSPTTKIRPVFDASAKDKHGRSLNLCLDKGINMLDKLPKLLNGFRKGKFGISADIAKAFLQISISPKDRDLLRFLWWDDKDNMITYRHCRLVFGLTSSPFLLSATIQHHLKQVTGDLKQSADILASSFYVDNCLTSLDAIEDVNKFQTEAKEIMSQAKFDLRQWVIAPNHRSEGIVSVLGLHWHTAEDELSCNISELPPPCEVGKITKRNLLSLAQRIYDPIGFVSAVTLIPRLILQETWCQKLNWDSELPENLKKRFITWYESLKYLNNCKIPRRLTKASHNDCSLQLHMFCDASQDGYAACVFLRAENNGDISLRIVAAKSRISPPKKLTIPRLELLAALIGSRLLAEARNDLKFKCKEFCWTDSSVALCWIRKELPWNTYVGNRVKEIRNNTNINNWFHIAGNLNWADLLSRGCDAEQLLSSHWLEGPTWLNEKPENWPQTTFAVDGEEVNRELKKKTVCNANLCPGESILNRLSYFSKYTKIIRTVAWLFRFTHNAQRTLKIKGELTYEEYEESEKRVIKLIQAENIEYIEKKIQGLTYFYDNEDGLLKVKTKLILTNDIPDSTKFPVVIPANNLITRCMVIQRHQHMQHAGVATVMADLRTRYWIIGARQLVKSVVASCTICRRHRAKPIQAPTAPLPPERTQCTAPFQTTGVDLLGPLYLRGGEKCWVVLYTCAVYRAVHLELTMSLSTEAFLMTLRRFIARRGRVNIIMSDNGSNFVGAKNSLSDLDWNEIQRQSTIHRIKWKLNAPSAAWWGGFWERLIKILKDLLKRVLKQASVTYVELETILCDCEATMNGRPLTYIEDEKTHSLEPLKPSCFLQPIVQTDVSDIDEIDSKNLNKRLRYIQKLREDFRQRFKTEYLTTLVQRGREKKDDLKIGEIVLIETDDKRIKWPIAIITEIFPGRDKVNRTAKVRTSTGYKVRPFQRLYKLEVCDPEIEFPQPRYKNVPTRYINHPSPSDACPADSASRATLQEKGEKTTRSGRAARMPSRYLI